MRIARIAGLLAMLAVASPALAANESPGAKVPRFASLRSGEVNVRTGPGVRYPVDWVFVRKNMPVEVVAEFDTWRKIRDWQGTEGWVHQSMLSRRRTAVVLGDTITLRRTAAPESPTVAQAEAGVIGQVIECREAWCRFEAEGVKGWVERERLWGVYPQETIK